MLQFPAVLCLRHTTPTLPNRTPAPCAYIDRLALVLCRRRRISAAEGEGRPSNTMVVRPRPRGSMTLATGHPVVARAVARRSDADPHNWDSHPGDLIADSRCVREWCPSTSL